MMNKEMVNHPEHYNNGSVECIDAIVSARGVAGAKEFCICNAMKYLWRVGKKDDACQDVSKAKWYLDKYLELTVNGTPKEDVKPIGDLETLKRLQRILDECKR